MLACVHPRLFSDVYLSDTHVSTQMYLRLGELPLYLSRSSSEGGFKRMKDGYFKTQAISPLVEEVRSHPKLIMC